MKVEPAPRLANLLRQAMPTTALPPVYTSSQDRVEMALAALYVLWTVVCSALYVFLIDSSFANDAVWAGFNASAHQTYLADLVVSLQRFNRSLLDDGLYLDYNTSLALDKTYYATSPSSTIRIEDSTAWARDLWLRPLPLHTAINMLRAASPRAIEGLATRYCWADLARTIPLSGFASWCNTNRSQANAAVYLEAVLRNVPASSDRVALLARINATIASPLGPRGRAWLTTLATSATNGVADEAKLWSYHGLQTWQFQYDEAFDAHLTATLVVRNALGMEYPITLTPRRWLPPPPSQPNGFWADVATCVQLNCALVQGTSTATGALASSAPYAVLQPAPRRLQMYFTRFQLAFAALRVQDGTSVRSIPGSAPTFLQRAWCAADAALCPTSVSVASTVFAMLLLAPNTTQPLAIHHICGSDTTGTCVAALTSLAPLHRALQEKLSPLDAIAAHNATAHLTLVTADATAIALDSLDAWIVLHEWLLGHREASFHAATNVTKLSHPLILESPAVASANDVPVATGMLVMALVCYTSGVLATLALLVGLLALRYHPSYAPRLNFLHFNRLAGFSWLGRPAMLVRSLSALVYLSSATTAMVTAPSGYSYFEAAPKSLVAVAVASGEATWLVYLLQDALAPVTVLHRAAPVGSFLAWLVLVLVSYFHPVGLELYLDTDACSYALAPTVANCAAGVVYVGSLQRVLLLIAINATSVCVGYHILQISNYYYYWWWWFQAIEPTAPPQTLLFSASVAGILVEVQSHRTALASTLDVLSSTLAGYLPGRHYVFDVNLWVLTPNIANPTMHTVGLRTPTFAWPVVVRRGPSSSTLAATDASETNRRWRIVRAGGGVVYVALTVACSFGYLDLASSAFSTALFSANFDAALHLPLLAQWFSAPLSIAYESTAASSTSLLESNSVRLPNESRIWSSALDGARLHMEATLPTVIAGLRSMDTTLLPYIFTPYCFLDLNQTWEMAASSARQSRCYSSAFASNGAVYLESVLSNTDWDVLARSSSWHGLNSSILDPLRASDHGRTWMQVTAANVLTTSIESEAARWERAGIATYTTQWQNYKVLGLRATYDIVTAYGATYAMPLTTIDATFHVRKQSCLHMYWGFASDLYAVSSNTSSIYGKSLLRSPAFAYATTSIEDVLIAQGIVATPLDTKDAMVRAALGPFGTIDMLRGRPPDALVAWYKSVVRSLRTVLDANATARVQLGAIPALWNASAVPQEWLRCNASGMDILCPSRPATPLRDGLPSFFTANGGCSMTRLEYVRLDQPTLVYAILLIGASSVENLVPEICAQDVRTPANCLASLQSAQAFVSTFIASSDQERLEVQARTLVAEVSAIEVAGLLADTSTLSRLGLVASAPYAFFGWAMLLQWVQGMREVVTFQGDVASLTLISTYVDAVVTVAGPDDVPHAAMRYMTTALCGFSVGLLCVAALLFAYTLAIAGQVEGWNFLQFNRVAGAVWLGRPLQLVRGVTALVVLSTGGLHVDSTNDRTRFVAPPVNVLWVLAAAGETSWLVYVANDVFSMVTATYTQSIAVKSSVMAFVAVSVWTFAAPIEPIAHVARSCSTPIVDGLVVCTTGQVEIGSLNRCLGLLGALAASFLTSVIADCVAKGTLVRGAASLFLHATAARFFRSDEWLFHGVYCLDRASALLNGVVSLEHGETMYVFDLKTWRGYKLPTPLSAVKTATPPDHIVSAIPLLE
ncbi:hypothetical protein SDRG_07714 [Saprolegnia diclina VS20]|uniref:Uncharacterized protein n=1 Tax=Saprolegnia diclina (strain VS20) TaxID=1156394 RepID=T0QM93_SAPDV|nr:hypothetical protein SDRG_07714 [Saprolegnia diclina VS20]EQC34915.1 hypothetical protein SDRG_07714 [Saprolegnia diclina VS20]|eukprot:XP_008611787.1 hypothetical protein SDRG_07714 [Saprolegnia diclina VS20]